MVNSCRSKALLSLSVLLAMPADQEGQDGPDETRSAKEAFGASVDQLVRRCPRSTCSCGSNGACLYEFCGGVDLSAAEVRDAFGLSRDEYLNEFLDAVDADLAVPVGSKPFFLSIS